VLDEAKLSVQVVDENEKDIPCRITIVDEKGSLPSLGTVSNETLAVRPGVVYSSNGRAEISLPAGKYTVYAGRGFEYSIDSAQIDLKKITSRSFRSSAWWIRAAM
jgi:hypothetical protein